MLDCVLWCAGHKFSIRPTLLNCGVGGGRVFGPLTEINLIKSYFSNNLHEFYCLINEIE